MVMAFQVPQKENKLDALGRLLGVFNSGLQVKHGIDEAGRADEKATAEKQARDNANAGILTRGQQADYASKGGVFSKDSTPGSVEATDQNTNEKIYITFPKEQPSAKAPEYSQATYMGADGKEHIGAFDKTTGKTIQNQNDPLAYSKPVGGAGHQSGSAEFKSVPVENQETIKDLARVNAKKTSIANQMESYLQQFNATDSEDQKIALGGQMLKVLNSPEGADAIGAEEAKRLGSFLEYKIGNFTGPGSFIGRDLDQFAQQTQGTLDAVRGSIDLNKAEIERMYGRTPNNVAKTKAPPKKESGGDGTAFAGTADSKPQAVPGAIVKVGGKMYKVAPNGDDLMEIAQPKPIPTPTFGPPQGRR